MLDVMLRSVRVPKYLDRVYRILVTLTNTKQSTPGSTRQLTPGSPMLPLS